ncbi:hypothetical protein O7632_02190 [Solwaraspora sp. WMMD406]|uniref:LppU/SCO3897 family protein n=1 Tax=Solwaraspora sp. WMMD406 TaxID=3016095 RepID=UPI0024171443|nr:hypothetical protein [Solwaraspora sp. WMMD406]MDG4762930.1 hypothetical protein [Solwaraspora sp. WMMD406]
MTSEGTQHPGQEPEEAGVGGPAPYGSQRQRGEQVPGDDHGPGHPVGQWAPPVGGGWNPGSSDHPAQPGRPGHQSHHAAPPPYPPPPGGGFPAGPPAEPTHRAPGELGWSPPPAIPPAEPWSPQQAWRTEPDRPTPPSQPEPASFPPGPPPPRFGPAGGFEPANRFGTTPPEPQQPAAPADAPRHGAAETPRPGAALPFNPAGPTPLPPQEVRVPGASLAAALGGSPVPPPPQQPPPPAAAQLPPSAQRHVPPPHQQPAPVPVPQQPSAVPQQRTPARDEPPADQRASFPAAQRAAGDGPGGEAAGGPVRPVTAIASVPTGNRVSPPPDQAAVAAGRPPARPRVYGRPVDPEAAEPAAPAGPAGPDRQGSGFPPNGVAFTPPGSPVSPAEHGRPDPLPARPGQTGQAPPAATGPFGPRPPADAGRQAPGPDAAQLALPHLSAGAHIQPTSPADAVRGYRQSGAAPYGDLLDEGAPDAPHRHNGSDLGMSGRTAGFPPPEPPAQQPTSHPGVGYSPAAAPRPAGVPHAAASAAPADAGQWAPDEQEQNRFDAFRPDAPAPAEAEAKPEPTPQVRNGRVLLAVLGAAVLLVAIPLSLVWLITRPPGEPAFNPAVGECVKQSGNTAQPADCAEPNAFEVIAKVQQVDQCADPAAPHIEMPGESGREQVLCLRAAAGANPAGDPEAEPSAEASTETTG